MLPRMKAKNLASQSLSRDDGSGGYPSNKNNAAKGGMSTSSSSPNLFTSGLAVKREEKDNGVVGKKRRPPPTSVTSIKKELILPQPSQVLDGMLPAMKGVLFAQEVSNLQKTRELKKLLNCLSDWGSINDQAMLKLVDNLKQNVESLDEKMTPLVCRTLDADWCSRSPKVVTAFEDFISELLIIRPCYSGNLLQALIRKFLPQSLEDTQNPDCIKEEDQKTFNVVHRNLAKLLEAFPIPRMKESCVKTMGSLYPYMGRSPYMHFCYVHNLIKVMEYAPQITYQILHLCIHKICRIDVNVPRDHSELLSEMINETILTHQMIKSESGGQKLSIELDSRQVINSIIAQSAAQLNPLVNTVDLCLSIVLECIETILKANESTEEDIYSLYDALLATFESEILPTFGIHNVQFIYFYLVGSQPVFMRKFLEFLWKKVTNVNTPAVIRMQCMVYISGVLTRSSVVSVKTLKRWLSTMADWANAYVDQRVKSSHWSSVNVQMHGPFYAVCQTIFYCFAFRNKDLVGSRKCTAFTGTLNLGRLVTCDLNPIKAVIRPVAVAFVKAAHVHQISYCQTVLERNQRSTIPTSVRESITMSAMDSIIAENSSILESFFPFDPFLLPRSKKWIDPIYRIYEAYLPEIKMEKCESPTRPDRFSDENDDSIDMELGSSYKDRSSQFMARLMNSSDIKDEQDEFMEAE